MKDNLGKRMKENYEDRFRYYLPRRAYTIIRVDGKAFHTLTRMMHKPFDNDFIGCMNWAAQTLLHEIEGAQCAYVQSDEISIVVTDFAKLETQAWFDNNLQKMCSVSASIATAAFNEALAATQYNCYYGVFDSRVFQIPYRTEVFNYLIWRQKDAIRNSIQSVAQANFSNKELNKKNTKEQIKMLLEKDVSWEALAPYLKYGRLFVPGNCYSIVFQEDLEFLKDTIPDNSL